MGIFDSFKRKPTTPTQPQKQQSKYKEVPSDYAEAMSGIATIFAQTALDQIHMLSRSRLFQDAGVPIGPAAQFEMACFDLAFVLRELDHCEYSPEERTMATDVCVSWFADEYINRYGPAVIGVINHRIDRYLNEIQNNWNEQTDHWDILFSGMSSTLGTHIFGNDSDELFLGEHIYDNSSKDLQTLYLVAAMGHELALCSLNTIPTLVFILRAWMRDGQLFHRTEAEMRSIAAEAAREANELLIRQSRECGEDEDLDIATENETETNPPL